MTDIQKMKMPKKLYRVALWGVGCITTTVIGLALWTPLVFFPSEEVINVYIVRYTKEPNSDRRAALIKDLVTRLRAPDTLAQSNAMASTFGRLEHLYTATHDEALLEGLEQPDLLGDTAMQRCFLYQRLSADTTFRQACRKRPRTMALVEECGELLGDKSFEGMLP